MNKLVDEIDSKYSTLGRDIGIYRRDKASIEHLYHNKRRIMDNLDGRWDRLCEKGDFVQVKGDKAVYNAITLSILTAFNELSNKGLKTYSNFGNKAYELLKENKNRLTLFKLESYFIKAIESIRRVRYVVEFNIQEYDVYSFDVNFTVCTIENTFINGGLNFNRNNILSHPFMSINVYPYSSIGPCESCKVTVSLSNSRGNGLANKLIRLYIDDIQYDYGLSDDDGMISFYINSDKFNETKIYNLNALFEGDGDFYPVESSVDIVSTQFRFLVEDGLLRLKYNSASNIPNIKLENNHLYIEDSNNEYMISDKLLFINI